jgi:hypothetical protein
MNFGKMRLPIPQNIAIEDSGLELRIDMFCKIFIIVNELDKSLTLILHRPEILNSNSFPSSSQVSVSSSCIQILLD